MNIIVKIIEILTRAIPILNTAVDIFFRLPIKFLRLIPGVGKVFDSLEGYRTIIANYSLIVLAFLQQYDWTSFGDSFCSTINFFLDIFKVPFECDPTWLPTLSVIFTALLNIFLRFGTSKEIPENIKPMTNE